MTKLDRCDRCGAEAINIFSNGDADLMFCQHHTNEYLPNLIAQGFSEVDSKLVPA